MLINFPARRQGKSEANRIWVEASLAAGRRIMICNGAGSYIIRRARFKPPLDVITPAKNDYSQFVSIGVDEWQ